MIFARRTLRAGSVVTAALAVAAVSGCSLLFQAPTVRVTDARLVGVSLTGASVELELEIENPNRYGLTALGVEYRLEFDEAAGDPSGTGDASWSLLAEGRSQVSVSVRARETARVPITVPFRYEDVGRAFLGLIQTGDLRYRLSGEVRFDAPVGSAGIPFEDLGRLGDG